LRHCRNVQYRNARSQPTCQQTRRPRSRFRAGLVSRTLRVRARDKHVKVLRRLASEVNLVYNFDNEHELAHHPPRQDYGAASAGDSPQ
jgi:hypothetical protein